MSNYLLNTLSGIISTQISLTDTLSTNYYNSQQIDQKLSGIPQLKQLQLDNLVRMTNEQINSYYDQVSDLENSFDF